MSQSRFKNYSDEYLISQIQGKKLEAEATAFLKKHGYDKYGKKLTRKKES